MLGLLGLATRRQLDRAIDRKQRWHGLVRHVFVPYYLKFQETALGGMPDLPARYSEDWVDHVEDELERFLEHDLQPVGELLEAAGFGTEKWERLQEHGFRALDRLLDRVAEGDDVEITAGDIDDAVRQDVRDLLTRHPDLVLEAARRIDPDTGTLVLTETDLDGIDQVRQLRDDLREARQELRRFRRGGQRALERIHELEARIGANGNGHVAPNGNGHAGSSAAPGNGTVDDEARQLAGLRKELRARDHRIAALREHIDSLEAEAAQPAPDAALQSRVAELEGEIEARDAQIVRQQERLEALESDAGDAAHDSDELRQLRNDLKARQHEIESLRRQLEETAQADGAARPGGDADAIDPAEVDQLRNDLKARQHEIESLRRQLEEAGDEAPSDRPDGGVEGGDADEIRQLRNDLKARQHEVESLRQQLDKARQEAEAAAVRERRREEGDAPVDGAPATQAPPERTPGPDLEQEARIEELQRDLKARDHKIRALRDKLEAFERELGQARERLVEQVRKLAALTEGEVEIKPSEELDNLDADQLLDYARDVAEDLDVRRQTLNEGLEGVESVKDSYEENRRLLEEHQQQMETQLEQLRTEVDSYREQEEARPDDTEAEASLRETITKQREQLQLLSTRVRQLVDTNKDLNESNKKIYSSLEEAAKRVIPLRRQIEELDTVQEALQRYIRQKFDRTFTIRRLQEEGLTR